MKKDCSAITEEMPVYHICHFVWDFLTPEERASLRSAALPFEAYAIWRKKPPCEDIHSLLLERPVPTGAPLSIDRVQKNGCALLHFDFMYGDLVH
jgi:hypothetical protein